MDRRDFFGSIFGSVISLAGVVVSNKFKGIVEEDKEIFRTPSYYDGGKSTSAIATHTHITTNPHTHAHGGLWIHKPYR